MKPRIYAHRGASSRYPENTLTAFQAALRHGADGLELDVQLTRDGVAAVIHDPRLDRTTDGTGWVNRHSYAALRRLDAGSWFHPRFRGARIPRLEDVFAFVQPTSLKVIVELKNFFTPQPELEERVVELIHSFQLLKRTVVSSFNFDSLRRVKELEPRLQTGMLYVGPLERPWSVAVRYRADQLHAPADQVTPSLVKRAKGQGLSVIAWTVNEPAEIRRIAAMGVDGLITDDPLLAKNVLRTSPT